MTDKPTDDDVVHIVCMRCDQLDFPAAGAVRTPCNECNELIWMAPSSVKFKTEVHPDAMVLCNECGLLAATKYKMEHPGEKMAIDAVPGSTTEIADHIRMILNAENN